MRRRSGATPLRPSRMSESNASLLPDERRDDGDSSVFSTIVRRVGQPVPSDQSASSQRPSIGASSHAQAPSRGEIDLRAYGGLAEIEREWKAFEAQADCTAFQAYDWLA